MSHRTELSIIIQQIRADQRQALRDDRAVMDDHIWINDILKVLHIEVVETLRFKEEE
jgi:hypothetical protein